MKRFWRWLCNFWKWVWKQLKDKTNLIIFGIVVAIVSVEVWLPILLSIITGNKWLWSIGVVCFGIWQLPGTPFIAICIGITFAVRKIYDKIKGKKNDNKTNERNIETNEGND